MDVKGALGRLWDSLCSVHETSEIPQKMSRMIGSASMSAEGMEPRQPVGEGSPEHNKLRRDRSRENLGIPLAWLFLLET